MTMRNLSAGAGGYRMIESFHIHNFRCFRDVAVSGCRRINLLVGANGSGKTSLLEALFLARGSNPELALRVRAWRGFDGVANAPQRALEEALWKDLFYDSSESKYAAIKLNGSESDSRSVIISYGAPSAYVDIRPIIEEPAASIGLPVTFTWRSNNSELSVIQPVIRGSSVEMIPAPNMPPHETFFFPANHTYSASETAARFSTLSKMRRENEAVALFCEQFPFITGLSIEVVAGAAMLHADVIGRPQKMPLPLISGGINKLAAILLTIPNQSRGVILVDEIENGIHYRRLEGMWTALAQFAEQHNAQVFASTHSAECIVAAGAVAQKRPDLFSVVRTRRGDDDVVVDHFDGSLFAEAVEEEVDIR